MRLHRPNYHDIERIIEFDFVRATEAAALNSLRWLGRGDKEKADDAACDAMRGMSHGNGIDIGLGTQFTINDGPTVSIATTATISATPSNSFSASVHPCTVMARTTTRMT